MIKSFFTKTFVIITILILAVNIVCAENATIEKIDYLIEMYDSSDLDISKLDIINAICKLPATLKG